MKNGDALPSRRIRLDGIAIAVVLACCLLWGLQQVIAKATLVAIPPLIQGGVRSGGAALLVWLGRQRAVMPFSTGMGRCPQALLQEFFLDSNSPAFIWHCP